MKAVRLAIPIPNYDNSDVFYQHLYFQNSPTYEQVKEVIKSIHLRESKFETYTSDWQDVLGSIIQVKNDWRFVSPTGCVGNNTFIELQFKGIISKYPISWDVITIFEN